MALTDKLTAIGDAIREKNGTTELIPLADIPQAILDISSGDDGYDFWDLYQAHGTRTDYRRAFCNGSWTDTVFKPKYDLKPTNMEYTFMNCGIKNLKQILEDLGVVLDVSNTSNYNCTFQNSAITHIGEMKLTATYCTNLGSLFYQATKLQSIDKLILKSNGSQDFNSSQTFGSCGSLEHMIVEGAIGKNGFNVQWSNLDLESAKSIINALVDYSGTTNEFAFTVKLSEYSKELLAAEGNTAPNGISWLEYVDAKGWNIA